MSHSTNSEFGAVRDRFEGPPPDHWGAVLAYFRRDSTGVATVRELGAYVRKRAAGDGTLDESAVAVRLHHATLPKMDANGILDYDHRSNVVRCRDQFASGD